MVSSILKVGNQLDIRIQQHVANSEKGENKSRVLRSMIYDIKENGELEIGMPMEGGKLVLLALGVRYELVFFTKGGMYRSVGQVKERYKSGNLYMVSMELKENLSKQQRREYYRLECLKDIKYLPLTPEERMLQSVDAILEYHKENSPLEFMRTGIAVDISGGGMRFISKEELQLPTEVLVKVPLGTDGKELQILGKVLSGKMVEGSSSKHEYRVKFSLEDSKIREEIIKFIFEEERKGRKIKKG